MCRRARALHYAAVHVAAAAVAAAAAARCGFWPPAHDPSCSPVCLLQTCLLAGLVLLLTIAAAHGAVKTGE